MRRDVVKSERVSELERPVPSAAAQRAPSTSNSTSTTLSAATLASASTTTSNTGPVDDVSDVPDVPDVFNIQPMHMNPTVRIKLERISKDPESFKGLAATGKRKSTDLRATGAGDVEVTNSSKKVKVSYSTFYMQSFVLIY